MNINLIGSGNVATHLGRALQAAGHRLVAVCSRHLAHAQALAQPLDARAMSCTTDLPPADVIIFAVSDAVLEELVAHVAPLHPEALFLHTAGSMPMQVFAGAARHYGVLYPLQTFSKRRAADFRSVPCFVEGACEADLRAVQQLAQSVADRVMVLDSARRRRVHLAAVFGCNFVNHCYAMADRLLHEAELPFDVLLPLIAETAAKVTSLTPAEAQTGPAVRADQNVMARQLQQLDDPEMRRVYQWMSEDIHRYAQNETI